MNNKEKKYLDYINEIDVSNMGDCEDCLYYHLGTCEEAEAGTEGTCFVDYYEQDSE